ncbi:LmeA family phospholipid-binding protein [Actinomyces qiguomingii]|uniref:LmeA family phospholipid-binding protein n=1 Tax=Actinomyces qiguomingii TaxID=2057800 RepID=UPI000CA03D03|nr:LmeA family phospholipid-binding protein [Actinomyces qiguomingii]
MREPESITPDAAVDLAADSPDAGGSGAVEEARTDDGAVSGRLRRRRRWWRALAVLIVLACLAGGGLVGAEHYARERIGPTVRAALPGLSDDAVVATEGLVLPQLLRHELTTLSIRADSLTLTSDTADGADSGLAAVTSLELNDVTADLTGVGTRPPHRVDRIDASAVIGFAELEWIVAAAVPDAPDLTIAPHTYGSATEPGQVKAATTVLGLEASLTIEPRVTDAGGLELLIVNVNVAGMSVDVDPDDDGSFGVPSVLSHLGLTTPVIEVGPEVLPDGMTLSEAYISRDGARLTLSGTEVTLADW